MNFEDETPRMTEEQRLKSMGVVDLRHNFESLKPVQGLKQTMIMFKKMASGEATWHMLLVCGRSGNGKTHLSEAVVIEMNKREVRCYRKKWSDIIRYLRAGFHPNTDEPKYEDRFQAIRRIPNLIIDDVGMGSTGGNWEWGELEDIVDYRLEERLFTIITSNLDLKEIPDRIVSRFKDAIKARLIVNEADDYRPKLGAI